MTRNFCDHCDAHIPDDAPWTLVQLNRRKFDLCDKCLVEYAELLVYMTPPQNGEHRALALLADAVQEVSDQDLKPLLDFVHHEGAL